MDSSVYECALTFCVLFCIPLRLNFCFWLLNGNHKIHKLNVDLLTNPILRLIIARGHILGFSHPAFFCFVAIPNYHHIISLVLLFTTFPFLHSFFLFFLILFTIFHFFAFSAYFLFVYFFSYALGINL